MKPKRVHHNLHSHEQFLAEVGKILLLSIAIIVSVPILIAILVAVPIIITIIELIEIPIEIFELIATIIAIL